jgi:hypothetical protein
LPGFYIVLVVVLLVLLVVVVLVLVCIGDVIIVVIEVIDLVVTITANSLTRHRMSHDAASVGFAVSAGFALSRAGGGYVVQK